MTNRAKLKQLFQILDQAEAFIRTAGKLQFDQQCCAPEEGMERAGEDIALVENMVHKLTHSKKYARLLTELHDDPEGLTDLERHAVDRRYEDWCKTKNISADFAYQMDSAMARAYGAWLTAKKADDYAQFKGSLAEIVDFTRRAIALRDERPEKPYDACLDDYEKGGNQAQLDAFFARLRERIVPLVKRIVENGKPIREDFLTRRCPIPQQEAFSKYLLEIEGLRSTALTLMTTEHPFTTSFGSKDVRVTTHYFEDNFISNIFSTLHEGGHALFMMYEPAEFEKNHVDNMMTSAMHECISRFYENIIGRSEAFIHFIYPKLCEVSKDLMDGVSERELYEGVNIARPSLIRTESDELTYCLHIMVRYEIERAMVNGEITVDEVPAMWNRKYKEYLGIDVPNDRDGCLQDVHWTMAFGYFPSYALGNAYGAQILRTMEREIDVWESVRRGDLSCVLNWLRENVFNRASLMDPDAWIRAITGEALNPDYYLDYLEDKYTKLYQI